MTIRVPEGMPASMAMPARSANRLSTATLPVYTPVDEGSASAAAEGVVVREATLEGRTSMSYPTAEQEKASLQASINGVASRVEDAGSMATSFSVSRRATRAGNPGNLIIPTSSCLPTSGFAFPPALRAHDITPDQWAAFTYGLTSAARLSSREWAITIGGATMTMVVTSAMVGWLGLVPAYLVGRGVRGSLERSKLKKGMGPHGELEQLMKRWNEGYFKQRGVRLWVELPSQGLGAGEVTGRIKGNCCGNRRHEYGDVDARHEGAEDKRTCCGRAERKQAMMERCRGKLDRKLRKKAQGRVRIVVEPLNADGVAADGEKDVVFRETERVDEDTLEEEAPEMEANEKVTESKITRVVVV